MRYWSKGLARRSFLNIDWSKGAAQISVENGRDLLGSVIPIHRVRGELPPEGDQVIVAGDTRPPIVWRYVSVLSSEDFESIVKLSTGPSMVAFLTEHPRGRRLFARLARFLVTFSVKYVGTWLGVKVRRKDTDRSGELVPQDVGEVVHSPEAPGSALTGGRSSQSRPPAG